VSSFANSVGSNDDDEELTVTAQNAPDQKLDADFTLAVASDQLTQGADDELTGAEGDNDLLALYGTGFDLETEIDDFETIQFGFGSSSALGTTFGQGFVEASGEFNAGNTDGTDTYIVARIDGSITLDNLSSGDTVVIGDPNGADDQTIASNNAAVILSGTGSGTLNVESPDDKLDIGNFGPAELRVDNFETVNVDLGVVNSGTPNEDLNLRLKLDGEGNVHDRGNPLTTSLSAEFDTVVDELFFTGGAVGDEDNLILGDAANDLQGLSASMSTIDFSGYNGSVEFALADADDGTDDDGNSTDTTIVLSEYDARVALTDGNPTNGTITANGFGANPNDDAQDVNFNTTFEFTAADGDSQWVINNFVSDGATGASLTNVSKLDLSGLG
ncbi:MAG: hypothetical protein LC687_08040, partial [Actinobacteria bacterium]|nr:hypothetical protein [Actinomycetota bacterium]